MTGVGQRLNAVLRLWVLVPAALFGGQLAEVAHGQSTFYYSGGTKTWSESSSWWLNYAGTQASGAAPGTGDTAIFNASGANAAGTAIFTGPTSLGGMQVLATATGALTLRGVGADQTLTLGAGGIRSLTSSAATFTVGSTVANQGLDVVLGASQEWRFEGRPVTLNDQIRGSAGSGGSQTLLIQTGNPSTAAVAAAEAVFADGANGGGLNLWLNTPGKVALSSANTLTGTLTIQSTGVGVNLSDGLSTGGTTGNSLRTLAAVQLAGGNLAATASLVALSGTGAIRVLGGASLLSGTVQDAGSLQRSVGGGLLGSSSGQAGLPLTGITNGAGVLVNGVLPWGFVGDSSGRFATIVSGTLQTASLTTVPSSNLNNVTGSTGNYFLNTATPQTLTKDIVPSALEIGTTTLPTLDLASFRLESNAIYFRTAVNSGTVVATTTISASGSGSLKIGSSGELVISARRGQVTLAAPIVGAGWVTLGHTVSGGQVMQDGWFALSGSNSHTGGTSIVSRGLNLNNAYALGSGTFRIGGNAIVLDNTSGGAITIATNNLQEWNSDFSFGGTQDLNLGTGAVSLGSWAGSWRTITTNGTATLTVGGAIGDGSYAELPTTGIIKSGSGVLALAGNNSYTGGTEFAGGYLSVTTDANLGAASAPLIFNGGALRVTGTSFASLGASRAVSGLGDQPLWFDVADATHTFTVGQNISTQAAGVLKKTGAGVLALTGTSAFTTAPSIDEGVVSVAMLEASGIASPLGAGSQINLGTATTAGTLRYTGTGAGALSRTVSLIGDGGLDASGAGALTVSSTVSVASGSRTFTLTGTSTALNTIGTITGTGVSVVKDGTGLWRLNAAKGFGGTLTVKNGTLQVASSGAAGSTVAIGGTAADASGVAAFLLEQDQSASPDFDVLASAGTQAVRIGGANTTGTATFSSGEIRMSRDVALVAATGGSVVFENSTWAGASPGSPADRNVRVGADGFAGRVLFNTFGTLATTGSVTVQQGTAVIGLDARIESAGTLSAAAGATLAGTGFVTNAIGGAGLVSPGNSPGILTAGSLDPSAGTDFVFEITAAAPTFGVRDASVNDVLRLTDATAPFASSLGSGNVVNVLFNLSGTAPVTQGTFTGGFFTDRGVSFAPSVASGSFAYWVLGSYGSGSSQQQFAVGPDGALATYSRLAAFDPTLAVNRSVVAQSADFGSGTVNGQITQFVVVPEPATLALAGLGSALLGWRLLRRRRAA
jgi:autotransporter-associated beta strand protein